MSLDDNAVLHSEMLFFKLNSNEKNIFYIKTELGLIPYLISFTSVSGTLMSTGSSVISLDRKVIRDKTIYLLDFQNYYYVFFLLLR